MFTGLERYEWYRRWKTRWNLKKFKQKESEKKETVSAYAVRAVDELKHGTQYTCSNCDVIEYALDQGFTLEALGLTLELWDAFRHTKESQRRLLLRLMPDIATDEKSFNSFLAVSYETGISADSLGYKGPPFYELQEYYTKQSLLKSIALLQEAIRDEKKWDIQGRLSDVSRLFSPRFGISPQEIEYLFCEAERVLILIEWKELPMILSRTHAVFPMRQFEMQVSHLLERMRVYRGVVPLCHTVAEGEALLLEFRRTFVQSSITRYLTTTPAMMVDSRQSWGWNCGVHFDPLYHLDELIAFLQKHCLTFEQFGTTEQALRTAILPLCHAALFDFSRYSQRYYQDQPVALRRFEDYLQFQD